MDIGELVACHAGWIRKTAGRFFRDSPDADDLASETICRILSNGERFNHARSFKPWAYTVMANIFRTQYARRRCVLFTGYDCRETICSGVESADQMAAVTGIVEIINECSRKSKCIECVVLYAEGYTYDEIARMLNIPVGTVRSRISSGRKLLRSAIR